MIYVTEAKTSPVIVREAKPKLHDMCSRDMHEINAGHCLCQKVAWKTRIFA